MKAKDRVQVVDQSHILFGAKGEVITTALDGKVVSVRLEENKLGVNNWWFPYEALKTN